MKLSGRINLIGGSAPDEALEKLPLETPAGSSVIWVVTNDAVKPVQSYISWTKHPHRSIKGFFKQSGISDYWLGVTPPLLNSGEIINKFHNHFGIDPLQKQCGCVDYPEIIKFLINAVPWKRAETPLEAEIRRMLEDAGERK